MNRRMVRDIAETIFIACYIALWLASAVTGCIAYINSGNTPTTNQESSR